MNNEQAVRATLLRLKQDNKIPNILFNGPNCLNKNEIINDFIKSIYNNNVKLIQELVMYVNCAHGKGISFIREDLKDFAKTNVLVNRGFKCILLYNGDKLTMDAQSALRRCIEQFSHNTRFFMVVEDKNKLLRPILSRFSEIFINNPDENVPVFDLDKSFELFNEIRSENAHMELINLVTEFYNNGFSALQIIELIEHDKIIVNCEKKYEFLVAFEKARHEMRNEKILMLFILHFINNANLSLVNMDEL